MTNTAFIDVDTVKDFFEGGKLAVPNAGTIRPNLNRLTTKAIECGIDILAFSDAHPEDAPEFKDFPPHCLIGTDGADKISETSLARVQVGREPQTEFLEADVPMFEFQKNTYNAFSTEFGNPNIDTFIKEYDISRAVVYGVVTEICVNAAIEGLLARNIETHVVVDAIMHLDETAADQVMHQWYERGAYLTTTDVVVL